MPTRLPRLLALLLATFATTATQAGRPLATEDADTLDRGDCEWESFAGTLRPEAQARTRAWTTQLGCGIGWSTQVALAYSRTRAEDARSSGLLLGGKTRLLGRDEGSTGWTLAWGLTDSRSDGGSYTHDLSYLNLVATHELAAGLTGHANLGWLRSQKADSTATTWNLALEQAVGAGVDLMGEVYGDDHADPWLGLGLRWAASERISLNGSWARQGGSSGATLWTLGFKLAF